MAFNPMRIFRKKEKDVVIDLSDMRPRQKTSEKENNQENLAFLGNLASASESSVENNFRSNVIDPEKFERFGRRIDRLLERTELLEKKIERIEHRLDIGSNTR